MRCGSPVWIPIRTRTVASSGHGSAAMARWAATAACTAPLAVSKTTKKESPSVPSSVPPISAKAPRKRARWRSRRTP